jgi:hypothetical protein
MALSKPHYGQQHLFYDAIAIDVLGIGCLMDTMLHAANLKFRARREKP